MKKRYWDTLLNSASSLCEGVTNVCRRSCLRSSWQVLRRSCCARSLCKATCLYKVSSRDLHRSSLKNFKGSRFLWDLWTRFLSSSPGLCTRSLQEVTWQDLCTNSLQASPGKISVKNLVARSLYKISTGGLLARFLYKLFIRALLARSDSEISAQTLYKSYLGKISVRDLLASWQDLCTRSL